MVVDLLVSAYGKQLIRLAGNHSASIDFDTPRQCDEVKFANAARLILRVDQVPLEDLTGMTA
jgi:hypothetical protein